MSHAMPTPAALIALAVLATPALVAPAAAQITADDLWSRQSAVITALGIQPTGTLARDGSVVTLSGAGGAYSLPFNAGRLSWTFGDVTLTEQPDGSVLTEIGAALPITISVNLSLPGGIQGDLDLSLRAEGLRRMSTGTPGMISTTTTADRIIVDVTDLRLPGIPELDDATIAGLVMAQDVDLTDTIGGDPGAAITLTSTGSVGRVVTDFLFSSFDVESRDVAEYLDSRNETSITLPATRPLDILNIGTALRDGFAISGNWSTGQTRGQTVTRIDGVISTSDWQSFTSLRQTARLDTDGMSGLIEGTGLDFGSDAMMPGMQEIGVTIDSFSASMALPLLSGMGRQTASLAMDLTGMTLGDGIWSMLGVPADDLAMPADIAFATTADFDTSVDLTDIMRLGPILESGQSPFTLYGVALDSLTLRYGEAALGGSGDFGWGPEGELLGPTTPPPEGQATFTLTGAYALIDRISRGNTLPPQALLGARGVLAAIGRPTGPDTLQSVIEFGPDGPRINGAPIPF